MRDGGGDLDKDLDNLVGIRQAQRGGRSNLDVRQVYYGQLTERDGVLRVCDGGNEI